MKATLEFNDERAAFLRAVAADEMCEFIQSFSDYLRGQEKYDGKDDIGKIRETFHDLLAEAGINLDKLY